MKKLKVIAAVIAILIVVLLILQKKFNIYPPVPKIFGNKYEGNLPLDSLKLEEGFVIDVYAEGIKNARSLCYAPSGTLYVSTRSEGKVYALKDTNGDMRADTFFTILEGANMPNGVAWLNGDLYIAEVNRILKFEDIESKLTAPGEPKVIYDKYPTDKHHGWKYIAFGPDEKLYVPVGAPCNICESADSIYASITRINPDGTGLEILHSGIRNTVGFDWHPETGELWFTDNGRDLMGDEVPECELNHATVPNMHFGFPYCHQGDVPDPEFGEKRNCSEFTSPVAKMGPHTAPLGMTFYTGKQFPTQYHNQIFVARHGSWNRSKKSGYDIVLVTLDADGKVKSTKPFITGWLNSENDDVWGRPVDFEILPDGSMLISDDFADAIYRIYYKG
ncbi:MAG: sorbosone dehydrogenase family protein [Saprospiraceae bacterium]|nr:sorbosone dehydrogenase family protein [Saprospiraceae bacterium]